MISYQPLWETIKRKGATTYTLEIKAGISSTTMKRLRDGDSVSTNTIDTLCKALDCTIAEIIEFVKEE